MRTLCQRHTNHPSLPSDPEDGRCENQRSYGNEEWTTILQKDKEAGHKPGYVDNSIGIAVLSPSPRCLEKYSEDSELG